MTNYTLKDYAEMIIEECNSRIEKKGLCNGCHDTADFYVDAKEQVESTLEHFLETVIEATTDIFDELMLYELKGKIIENLEEKADNTPKESEDK